MASDITKTVEAEAWGSGMSAFQDEEERRVLYKTIDSFYQYRHQVHYNTTHRRRQNFYALPRQHQELLLASPFNMRERFAAVDAAIDENAAIAEAILNHALNTFGFDVEKGITGDEPWQHTCTTDDLAKASTTINQFYRDWSAEGQEERDAHYEPVMDHLEHLFDLEERTDKVKVLVPGAGLGRLVFELCRAGFDVEGNEISFHALLASNWILNSLKPGEQYPLHPFVLRFSNHREIEDQLETVQIPDIHPGSELQGQPAFQSYSPGAMSMSASDFLTAYQQEEQKEMFDVVATVFFIDTAPNIIRYIEAIRHTLKEGGYWINVGPLLWHFEEKKAGNQPSDVFHIQDIPGIEEPGSVELTHKDIINLVRQMGFEFKFSDVDDAPPVGYIQQQTSMMKNTYTVSRFVAKKLPDAKQSTIPSVA